MTDTFERKHICNITDFEKFKKRLEYNGGSAFICKTVQTAADFILNIVLEENISRPASYFLSNSLLPEIKTAFKNFLNNNKLMIEKNYASDETDICIAAAPAILIQNGAAVVDSSRCRAHDTLFGNISVLIAFHAEIYDNMTDFFSASARGESSVKAHNITIIAGPSKTADIEKCIVTGMHGPKQLICVIIA